MQTANANSKFLLPDLLNDDTLSVSEVSEFVIKMKRLKDIEKEYKDKVKQRKDGRQFYLYLNRKQLTATTYRGLMESIYNALYGRERSSLSCMFEEWLIWKRDNTNTTGKTLKEYHYLWKKHFQDEEIVLIPMTELKPKDFVKLFRIWTKDRTMTKKYFNNLKSILNGIYAYAIEEEIVAYNPLHDISTKNLSFKAVNNTYDVFTLEERKRLLEYLNGLDDIYALAIMLDFHMVCRIGELLALKWEDIHDNYISINEQYLSCYVMNDDLSFQDRQHNLVDHVKGNADKGFRKMPLMPEAKNILERIRKINPTGRLILMNEQGSLTVDTFNRRLKKYCEDIGIEPRSSHKIRFTVASILYTNGVPLTTLQQLLGHTTAAMTLHYLRPVVPIDETYDAMQMALGQ